MKKLTLSVAAIALLGTLTIGMAAEVSASGSASIDAQITAIENAKTQEQRVELMNKFKTTVSTLSQEDRAAAIDQLRTSMHTHGTHTQSKAQMQARLRVSQAQAQENQNMQTAQNMNQHRAASQAKGEGMMSGSMGAGANMMGSHTTNHSTGASAGASANGHASANSNSHKNMTNGFMRK